ncbi:3'-5' exonuclease [Serratia sp. DD3]|uniref:3'-5' exonuclease n=1 Tax=Serratia sp. DD3 TaxID=1410619 RepID=UPI0003C509C4|nr:3'-5' exonuclease [Serratia sp. DD3]KEY58463.1 exonuclease [Serratia sp. DD3]
MNNIMLDLETMGNNPNAPIVAIGAVFFDIANGTLGDQFYTAVDLESEMALGAVPNADTIKWWLKQGSEARAEITSIAANNITAALSGLFGFACSHCSDTGRLDVWGNGASFDNVILRAAYERVGIDPFWNWWNDRDVRTMVMLGRQIDFDPKRDMPFSGERHNALNDAIHQAQYVSAIYQRLMSAHQQDQELS